MTSARRALILVPASSVLVPVVGLVTSPVLAQSLGVDGRGQAAAAAAPFLVASVAGSLGLPQAVTYYVAQGRRFSRSIIASTLGITIVVGVAGTLGVVAWRGYLSGENHELSKLIVMASALITPALLVGLLRGRAAGLQRWNDVAIEKVVTTLVRAISVVGLAIFGELSVLAAVLAICLSPILGGLIYIRGVRDDGNSRQIAAGPPPIGLGDMLRFGSSVWLGSVATMLMARVNEIFVIPLSDAAQLGLLVVAVTISDVPWIVTQALRDVLFGTSSHKMDKELLTQASRLSTAGAALLCSAIALTLPFWLAPVFGRDFGGALWPTNLLLISAVVSVPGIVGGAALEAAGRPRARAFTVVGSLFLNVCLVFLFVPSGGAIGAATAVLLSATAASLITVLLTMRQMDASLGELVVLDKRDLQTIKALRHRVAQEIRRRRGAKGRSGDSGGGSKL